MRSAFVAIFLRLSFWSSTLTAAAFWPAFEPSYGPIICILWKVLGCPFSYGRQSEMFPTCCNRQRDLQLSPTAASNGENEADSRRTCSGALQPPRRAHSSGAREKSSGVDRDRVTTGTRSLTFGPFSRALHATRRGAAGTGHRARFGAQGYYARHCCYYY